MLNLPRLQPKEVPCCRKEEAELPGDRRLHRPALARAMLERVDVHHASLRLLLGGTGDQAKGVVELAPDLFHGSVQCTSTRTTPVSQ